MLFALICKDKPGALQVRMDTRPDHVAFLDGLNADKKLAFAGPFLDADGNCPDGTVLTASAPIDGRAGDTCAYNLNDYSTLIPSTKRWQAYANGTFRLNDSVDAFGEVLYSDIKGTSWFGSSPYFTLESGRFALNADTGLAEPIPAILPASNPYNPYGRDVSLEAWRSMAAG